ncbi:protease Do-like 10 mitochondrial-like protein [Perkinsela sp. CCAP 1560/4]|nr:protease Do-like 10 mitochondrial-like protein [Perkinsela sp. CCAP 1560/4]|eukprot:KNH02446.1 protease Do-like 10 mitochondrial-like protein [Perkinsela sp. CCAP 1560/4]
MRFGESSGRLDAIEHQVDLLRERQENILAEKYSAPAGSHSLHDEKHRSIDGVVPAATLKSVVKVFCTTSAVNHLLPWQRKNQGATTGSGFVLDKREKLLITNAHVVFSSTFIEVRRHGESSKFTASVRYISADCDLALLHVEDPSFWAEAAELEFAGVSSVNDAKGPSTVHRIAAVDYIGGLPSLQQNIRVVGYPWGGDQVSITSGVVSRIDSSPYGGVDVHLIAIQIDAAVNPGNSGGPALCDNLVTGIAFQSLSQGENIGYIIPIPIIAHFLRNFIKQNGATDRFTAGHYHGGFCSIGAFVQELHNSSLRKKLMVSEKTSGILLLDILPTSRASQFLEPFDVVTTIDAHPMGNDATMKFRGERLRFAHFIQMKNPRDTVAMEIIRRGKSMTVDVELSVNPSLVPNHLLSERYCEKPKYVLFGGCVFTPLTLPLLLEWGAGDWIHNAPRHLTELVVGGKVTAERSEVVVLIQMFPHEVNKGYSSDMFQHRIVTRVGDVLVRDLAHFRELLARQTSGFAEVYLQNAVNTQLLVLPVIESREADSHVRVMYNIPVT